MMKELAVKFEKRCPLASSHKFIAHAPCDISLWVCKYKTVHSIINNEVNNNTIIQYSLPGVDWSSDSGR